MSTEAEFAEQMTMEKIGESIRRWAKECSFDYSTVPQSIVDRYVDLRMPHHVWYGKYRYAIATVLRAQCIYEVGVGWGIAARAFKAAMPKAFYYGIDNEAMGVPLEEALQGLTFTKWDKLDSDSLSEFKHPAGAIDLIHVDGWHERNHEARDIAKAIRSGAQWMLVDDTHDKEVFAALADGLYAAWPGGSIPMIHFENSHSGCTLIHTGAYR